MKNILIILSLFVSFLSAVNLEKVSLQLKWKYQFQFAGFITAYEKGFYKDAGFDVEIKEFTTNTTIVDDVLTQKIDFAVSDSSLVYDALKGKQVTAMMAVFQHSPFMLLGLKNNGIDKLGDLNGKKIALHEGTDGISIKAMLKTKNISYISHDPIFSMQKLIASEVDMMSSYISNEPYVAKQLNLDIKTFTPEDYGFEGYGDILFTSKELLKTDPETVLKFYKASIEGWKYAYDNTEEIIDLIHKKYNTLDKTKQALRYEANTLKNISGYGENLGEINKEKIKSIAQQFNLVKNEHNQLDILKDFVYSFPSLEKVKENRALFDKEYSKFDFLTTKEREYLKTHKTITVHNENDWAPYNYNKNGIAKGFSIDYINLIAKKLNVKINYIQGYSWSEYLDLIKKEKIDLIVNIAKNENREKYINFTTSYIKSKKAIFSNLPNIRKFSDLNGKTVAIPEQFYTQNYLSQHYPKIKIKTYKSTKESLYAVINKEADAIIENFAVVTSLMQQNGLNLPYVTLNDNNELVSSLHIGVRKSQPILRDIIEKAKATITDEEFLKLENKWFGLKENKQLVFTQEETKYIKSKKSINVCYHLEQHPWVMKIKDEMRGSSIEFLKHITKKSNLIFNMVETETVSEHFQKIKDGDCDISPIIVTKPNRFKFLNPTISMIEDNVVLVTKINEPYVNDLSDLGDKKIAIHKGKRNLIKYVKAIYPNINLIEIDGLELERVVNGEFYGYISVSYKMSYKIYPKYVNELKIMSKIGDKKIKGSFGISTREPILLSIFNKSLNDMSTLERQEIENAWVSVEVEKQFDYKLLLQVILVFTIIFLILFISYLKQKKLHLKIKKLNENLKESIAEEVQKNREKDKLMLSQSRLAQMGEIISMIAHQWRQPLNSLSLLNQTILLKYERKKLNDEAIEFFAQHSQKQIQEMSKTIDDFRDFFKPQKIKSRFFLNEIIENTIDMVKPVFLNHKISININLQQEYYVSGYENELGQALLNILNNAKDALIEKDIDVKQVDINVSLDEKNIDISISDNAGGIPADIIGNIFDPYFSTKGEKNGTGLGLYMTKMIIEEHMDGKISVCNNNGGALFTIVLKNNK